VEETFDNLYNSVPNGGVKDYFISRASSIHALNNSVDSLMLQEVIESIQNQKKGKSAGPNGLYIESCIYGGLKFYIHLSVLFTLVRHCYLPRSIMETVIEPMVINKVVVCGNLNFGSVLVLKKQNRILFVKPYFTVTAVL